MLAAQTQAQQADRALVEVHLINGKIIKGKIIQYIPRMCIKVKTDEQNINIINLDEIEKVKGGKMPMDSTDILEIKAFKNNTFRTRYFNSTELGIAVVGAWEVSNVNGIQLSPCTSLGVGFGISNYSDDGFLAFHTFLQEKTCFTKHQETPYFGFNLGYLLPFHTITDLDLHHQLVE